MSAVAALLKGVNVGGAHLVRMADLRARLEADGFAAVRTLLQSGNVVLEPGDRSPAAVAEAVARAVEALAGFRPEVIVRDGAELAATLARVPWPDAPGNRVLVTFLAGDPDPEGVRTLEDWSGPEQVRVIGRELHVRYDEGMARSEFAKRPVERLLRTAGTARNLNTLRKLVEITAA